MSQNVDINSLIGSAKQQGSLSAASANVLTAIDIGDRIREGLGVGVDDVLANDVILVTMLIDDSGSIRMSGNSQIVRDGHNLVVEALRGGKDQQVQNMLCHTAYLNGKILYPYVVIGSAINMESNNYDPNGGTPLYEAGIVTLGRVLTKAQEFSDAGVTVRTITLIVTDGASTDNNRTAAEFATVARDMYKKETHIIAGMGIADGSTDFKQVFRDMGIPDEWILTPGNTNSEIRKAFQIFSKSAVRASQNVASFTSSVGGGFVTVSP
jgi:hypothetical protein